ncbi:hypothetical protein ACOXVJ_25400 [Pseudomonas knackmussii]|uniref:hypothetical protein n=1 Tax=Pseudomonas knackmussii TaxID=65741 RepID=UPI003BCD5700
MEYKFQIASDVLRDGIGVELIQVTDSARTVIAEVFRCDAENTLQISLFSESAPFVQIERLVLMARKELVSFEDGTPLPVAVELKV